ncbi:MAG: hypothetical protein MO852_08030, partial [Candidatus Devosia euplotis]|nr:hypothetical protein [Candidatus Devosia euplotis]
AIPHVRAAAAAFPDRRVAIDRQFLDRVVFFPAWAWVRPEAARTARVRNGTAMVTDGPLRNQRKC